MNLQTVLRRSWAIAFQISALLLAVIEAGGAIVGGWMLYTLRRSVLKLGGDA